MFMFLALVQSSYSQECERFPGDSTLECERFLRDSSVMHASFSMCIADAATGIPVIQYNEQRSLRPASIMKLITSAAALELLGPDYTFHTDLGYTGTISKSGKLTGDIVIKGGGDPAFASRNFPDYYKEFPDKWIEEIKKLGIRKITGSVITDDSRYDYLPVPAKWLWEDAGNYYGAGAYGASVFDNSYEIHLKTDTGTSGTIITRFVPEECRSELSNRLVAAGTTDLGYVFAAPYGTNGWLAGSIPVNSNDFVLEASVTDPPLLIARIIKERLNKSGIKVSGEATTVRLSKGNVPEDIKIISDVASPPLREITEVLNHKSVNLYAEHLTKELGKKFRNSGSTKAGTDVIYSFLDSAGISTGGMFIEDGSGLSPVNAINSASMVTLLRFMKNNGKYYTDYFNSLPVAGKEGTLRNYFHDDLFSSLRAKSGSMTRVRSYAGYFTTNSGRDMVFCMIINDFSGPPKDVVTRFEALLKEIILNK